MKLAEALANRADLQRRIEQMRGRLQKSALVQEGESPPEKPEELLEEMETHRGVVLQQVTPVFADGGERQERRRLSKHRRITVWSQKPTSRSVPGRHRGGSSPHTHRRAQHQ